MKATVIVDNIGNIYPGEWGLCIYIPNLQSICNGRQK